MAKTNSVSAMALQLQKLSNEATEKSFQYNAQEANTARSWQKMMSDTSHQREVADLKAAGLNPVLSSGGSGAQSYTTTSASASAENAASAVGGLYQAKMSSDATRAAAAQQAAATRHAAAVSAAAQRYAAAMSYQASVFHSQKSFDAQVFKSKMAYKATIDKPASNWTSLLDKWSQKTGISNQIVDGMKASVKALHDNPSKYFKNNGAVGINNFKLNKVGTNYVNSEISKVGLKPTKTNRDLFVKAFVYGDKKSLTTYTAITKSIQAAKKTYDVFKSSRTRSLDNYYAHH